MRARFEIGKLTIDTEPMMSREGQFTRILVEGSTLKISQAITIDDDERRMIIAILANIPDTIS